MCANNQGAIYTWTIGAADKLMRRPYRCCSWRHEGACARREAAITFARIKEAMGRGGFSPDGWVFMVLTLDRDGYESGQAWPDVQTAFRSLSVMSRNFMARVRRLCERNGWRSPGSDWVATVEAHRSGWPHVNFVMYAPELAAELELERRHVRKREAHRIRELRRRGARRFQIRKEMRAAERNSVLLYGELLAAAQSTGWGFQSTAEQARSPDALAGYVVKLAGEQGATAGEIAKLTQLPTNAEGKFRRLRSGKGFLPPRHRDETITGTMVRRELDVARSAYGAVPLHEVKDPELARMVERCAQIEEDRMGREAHARAQARELGIPYAMIAPPPVESIRIIGENFEVCGASISIEGERGYTTDREGFLKWSEPRDVREGEPPPW